LSLTLLLCLFWASDVPQLRPPIEGLKTAQIQDTFTQIHSGHPHEAIDILAPRGTPVLAVRDGRIQKLFLSKPGGVTIYQFDDSEPLCYYYAHLDRYAPGLKEGMRVKQGDVIGFVGSTGNADPAVPHLHFAVNALGPGREWWKGTPINPHSMLVDAVRRGGGK